RTSPAFRQLGAEYEIDNDYYDICGGTLRPNHHWVFLGEITHDISLVRPFFLVKDRSGDRVPVAFHHATFDELLFEFNRANYVVGHTIAVFYAENHAFLDMSYGVRIDSLATIIPCSLSALLSADPAAADAQNDCEMCHKSEEGCALLRCSRCKTKYCSKECQLRDWKTHKSKCTALHQVRAWSSRNWDEFAGLWYAF
ncbi:hypothetical protein BC835DRAFT_1269591, partial [Cytidiella melzeri]